MLLDICFSFSHNCYRYQAKSHLESHYIFPIPSVVANCCLGSYWILLCDKTFPEETQDTQIWGPPQIKVQTPPKSNLVDQWLSLMLFTRMVRNFLEEHKWLSDIWINIAHPSTGHSSQPAAHLTAYRQLIRLQSVLSWCLPWSPCPPDSWACLSGSTVCCLLWWFQVLPEFWFRKLFYRVEYFYLRGNWYPTGTLFLYKPYEITPITGDGMPTLSLTMWLELRIRELALSFLS